MSRAVASFPTKYAITMKIFDRMSVVPTARLLSRRSLFDGGRSAVFDVVPGTGSGVL